MDFAGARRTRSEILAHERTRKECRKAPKMLGSGGGAKKNPAAVRLAGFRYLGGRGGLTFTLF
jgi:hypothetical protein